MPDSMEAFWGRLGAFADPVNQLAEASCGCALGATDGAIDASDAASRVISQYVALSAQGEKLRQQMVAGVKIPCEVWIAYAIARQDYLNKSQPLFDQLAAKGVTIEQVVYSGGKPVPDPSDPAKYKTLRVQAPLRPPAFVGIDQQCPGTPVMYGANLHSPIGWEPIPISFGSVDASTVSALGAVGSAMLLLVAANGNALGLAGYGAYKTIKQIAVALQDYDAVPSKVLTAYTACFDLGVKSGLSAADAVKRCSTSTSAAQTPVEPTPIVVVPASRVIAKGSFWTWFGIGAVVFIVGSLVVRAVRGRASMSVEDVGRYSRSHGPILIGDLYFHPRGRR